MTTANVANPPPVDPVGENAAAIERPRVGWAGMLSGLWHRPGSAAALIFLLLVVVMAVFAPLLSSLTGNDPYAFNNDALDPMLGGLPQGGWGGISADHWFGVEPQNGRDIFARIAYGARSSFLIALSATIITTVVGTTLGMIAGFIGGMVDTVISRVMDLLLAFPALIFMIALISALPTVNRHLMLIVVLSLFGWPYIARVIRGQTMSLARREFAEAAAASGASRLRVVFSEILPNLTGTIIVLATLAVPGYIGTEAGLSFLGIGLVAPAASWGQMIQLAVGWFTVDPMYFIIPGAFLTLTVLSFMVIGDRMQVLVDPRTGGR